MTIYTTSTLDEKDKAKLIPEVVTESMSDLKAPAPATGQRSRNSGLRVVEVTFFGNRGRSFYVHLLFALAGLGILAFGALGAVIFYRHLHKMKHETYSGRCGTLYFDATYHDKLQPPFAEPLAQQGSSEDQDSRMGLLEEDMVVEEDYYEELHTPAFDEVRESYVRHDFRNNFTAIVDHRFKQCYLMKLNRTVISPPRTVIELIQLTIRSHNILQRATVIRQDYEIAYAMDDLSMAGGRIAGECAPYPTHWLEKKVGGVFKRSVADNAAKGMESTAAYAMLSHQVNHATIFKLFIHNTQQ